MTQTRRQSLIETLSNTALGIVGSFLITMVCLHFFTTDVGIAISTTLACTAWSIVRGFYVRRWWNNKLTKETTHEE